MSKLFLCANPSSCLQNQSKNIHRLMKSWSIQYCPCLKKKRTCTYTDYSHNSIITHPGTWLDTYCSAYSHKVWTFSVHSTQSMLVFTQHWDWGTCLSMCSIQSPFWPGMWSLHLHREASIKSGWRGLPCILQCCLQTFLLWSKVLWEVIYIGRFRRGC